MEILSLCLNSEPKNNSNPTQTQSNDWSSKLEHAPAVRAVGVIHHLASNIAPEFSVVRLNNRETDNSNNSNTVRVHVFGLYDWSVK